MKLLVLHGVNLNMFGQRDPAHYGTATLADIDTGLRNLAQELGVSVECFQTNHEGALCERIHQAHRDAARVYSALVADWAQPGTGMTVWDLYGGVGVFAATLGDAVGESGRVLTVDTSRASTRAARVALADLPQVSIVTDSVRRAVSSQRTSADVVVLDPPRSGAGRDVIDLLAAAEGRPVPVVDGDPHLVTVQPITSASSMRTEPVVASCRRGISARAVDLPPPDGPTRATVVPGWASKLRPARPVWPSG